MSETSSTDALSGITMAGATPLDAIRAAAQSSTTQLQVPEGGITPTQIVFQYATPPGNQPATYGNTVFLWQTSGAVVPIGVTPLASARIAGNQPNGSGVVNARLMALPYLLAYATGPRVENVCAVVLIPVSGPTQGQAPAITVEAFGATWLTYGYSLPAGTQPASDGHWVGIWRGQASGLYSVPPLAFVPVAQDMSTGQGVIDGLALLVGSQYTLGYFAGGYDATAPSQTALACSYTFTT
jgi:hypothetical protein